MPSTTTSRQPPVQPRLGKVAGNHMSNNQRRPVMTASPTHTTPHHATRYSRETAPWLPTMLITGSDRRQGNSMGRPKADDLHYPNCLMTGLSTGKSHPACETARGGWLFRSTAAFSGARTTTQASWDWAARHAGRSTSHGVLMACPACLCFVSHLMFHNNGRRH